jgi:hypothetical protein
MAGQYLSPVPDLGTFVGASSIKSEKATCPYFAGFGEYGNYKSDPHAFDYDPITIKKLRISNSNPISAKP